MLHENRPCATILFQKTLCILCACKNCRKHFEERCHQILSGHIGAAASCSIHPAEGDRSESSGRLDGQGSYLTEGELLKMYFVNKVNTLGPTYNEFGYNKHPAITSRFLCIKIIDCHVKKIIYNEHPLTTSSFFCMFLLIVSGTQCKYGEYSRSSNVYNRI